MMPASSHRPFTSTNDTVVLISEKANMVFSGSVHLGAPDLTWKVFKDFKKFSLSSQNVHLTLSSLTLYSLQVVP